MTVEWLLWWAFARERVHLARPRGMGEIGFFTARGMPKISSSERIGAAVGSSMNLGFEAPRDAYAAMEAVSSQGAMARMIREFAMMGDAARPDWTPRPEIFYERTGVVMGFDDRKRRRVVLSCIHWAGDLPGIVDERRRVYVEWAYAIARVHGLLRETGVLVTHELVDDVPPLEPWLSLAC